MKAVWEAMLPHPKLQPEPPELWAEGWVRWINAHRPERQSVCLKPDYSRVVILELPGASALSLDPLTRTVPSYGALSQAVRFVATMKSCGLLCI